jgi:4'-phosphopantetheinyl transferase
MNTGEGEDYGCLGFARNDKQTLTADEAHIWYTFTDKIADPALLAEYRAVLSAEERARLERFYFEKHRHSFLVSHAMLRVVLSLYADVLPAEWTFVTGSHGKPDIANSIPLPLRFNLSHTQGLAAVIVARDRDVGVDVEHVNRREVGIELAERYFAPSEVAALRAVPEPDRRERFFAYWTLKEAYIKARGLGLSLPLDGFAFDLETDRPGIAFNERIADQPAAWQFARHRPGPDHALAVAIHRADKDDLAVVYRPIVPIEPHSSR